MNWNEIEQAINNKQHLNWFNVTTDLFNRNEQIHWQNVLTLLRKAEISASHSQYPELLLYFTDYGILNNHSEKVYEYLLGINIYSIDSAELMRKYYQLANEFNEPHERTKAMDWLRHNGFWSATDEEKYQEYCNKNTLTLINKPKILSKNKNPIRQLGQSVGHAITGSQQSVFSLYPPKSTLSEPISLEKINQMSGSARMDMRKILSKVSGTSPEVISTGLDAAVEQYLWLGQLDNTVLQAISFASAGNSTAFDNLLGATEWFDEGRITGNLPRLYGYVAEQQTMLHLLQQGHQVELAEGATQAGWDLLVDGQEFQVKHTLSSSLIEEHFRKYPDIPVIVNSELALKYENDDRVWIDYDRIHPNTVSDTVDTLSSLHQGGSTGSIVLHFMLAGIRHMNKPESKNNLIKHTTKDFIPSIICTKGGAALATTVAAMSLGPVGIAMSTVIGAMVGNGIGDSIGKAWINSSNKQANNNAAEKLIKFGQWFIEEPYLDKLDAVQRNRNHSSLLDKKARSLGVPSSITTYWTSIAAARLEQINYFGDVIDKKLAGSEKEQIQAGWLALEHSVGFSNNSIRAKIRDITKVLSTIKNS